MINDYLEVKNAEGMPNLADGTFALSFLLFAFTFLQKKTTRMLGILGCLGFGVLSVYLILIRFIAINPMMMGLAAIGGLVSLAFYGLLIKQLYHHSV